MLIFWANRYFTVPESEYTDFTDKRYAVIAPYGSDWYLHPEINQILHDLGLEFQVYFATYIEKAYRDEIVIDTTLEALEVTRSALGGFETLYHDNNITYNSYLVIYNAYIVKSSQLYAALNKILKVTVTVTPSNLPFSISTWIGPDKDTKIVAPSGAALISIGAPQSISFAYVLPSSGGPYKVFVLAEISGRSYLWTGDSSSYVTNGRVG